MCYNDAGSVIGWGGTCLSPTYSYTWDPLKQMASTFGSGFTKRTFFYTADGERIEERVGSDPLNPTSITVSARGLDGKVLRLFTKNGTWSWTKDYVYRDGAQLASVEPPVATPVTKYFHLDHLGTIRRITNTASPAAIIASHDYYPFGLEATDPSLDSERMKWTGHERDQQGTPSVQTDDLDYMHARFENFNIGRFLSIDPVRGNPKKPQSFNLFAYARNNPINLTDPLGLEPNSLEPLPSGSIPITQDQVCDPNLVGDPDCPTTQALPPPETPEIKPLPADAGSNGGDTESEQSLLPAPRDWDYYSVCYTQPLFQTTTAGMTGVTFGVSLDQAGNLYVAVGGSVGKSLGTVPSFSAVGGMISPSSTVKPNANQVESFLTGWAMNFTVGSVVTGSGATRSLAGSMAGTRSGEFGLASPQVGVTLSYGSKVLNLNAIASRLFWGGR
jgi:RHS repeat-associated protein